MPWPVSVTLICAWPFTRASPTTMRPPAGVNFTALERRFQTTCCRRSGSPTKGAAVGWRSVTSSSALASMAGRSAATASPMTATRSIGRTFRRSMPVMMRETSRRSLMICAWARGIEPRVVEGRGGAPGQVLGKGQVGTAVAAARFRRAERDGAEPPAPRAQRYHHDRPQPQRAKRGAMLGIGADRVEDFVGHVRMELRLPRAQDFGQAVGAEVDRLVVGQLASEPDVGGIDAGGGEPADAPVLLEDIDRAQIGEPPPDQTGHPSHRGL